MENQNLGKKRGRPPRDVRAELEEGEPSNEAVKRKVEIPKRVRSNDEGTTTKRTEHPENIDSNREVRLELEEGEPSNEVVKRTVGRPKKVREVRLELEEGEPSNEAVKRKVGRPKKVRSNDEVTTTKRTEHPEKNDTNNELEISRIRKQKKRDIPKKAQWLRIVGSFRGSFIPTQRLPTNRVVLQRFDMLRDSMTNKTSTHEFAELLYLEIIPIWQKANIPVVVKKHCVWRIEELIKSWRNKNCRKMIEGSKNEIEYTKLLNSLCSMTYLDLEEVKNELKKNRLLQEEENGTWEGRKWKRWELDYEFLLNQMKHPQIGTIGVEDCQYRKKKSDQIARLISQENLKEGEEIEKLRVEKCLTTTELVNILGDEDANEENHSTEDKDSDYVPPRGRAQKKHSKVTLELPTKDLVKDAAPICARLKLSLTTITSLYAKIIVSGGGDLKDFVMSKSSTWRHRISGEKEVEKKLKIKLQEMSAKNPYAILHWDGKKVKFETGDDEEHLIICLQQVSSEQQPQFLGAPQTPDGTGVAQVEALVRYIDDTGIENQVVGHVWDTTPANTGPNLGSAVLLDQALGRANLWIGCRRHAGERHVVHANTAVFGETKGPDEPLFKLFQSEFDSLDRSLVQTYEWAGDESSPIGPYLFQTERALAVKIWAEECCANGVFPREDYRELLELITHALGGQIVRRSAVKKAAPPKMVKFNMERPGALHHARFMAKSIYYIKMFMLTPQLLNQTLITRFVANKIKRMATYIILLYGQYFLQTALTTAAPRIDLEFWRNANKYSHIDKGISNAVMKSVQRQMFYLVEETVLFSLCDNGTTVDVKRELIEALLDSDRLQTFPPMKPLFKTDKLERKTHDTPKLRDFVGPRSWLLFDLFDVDVHWMEYAPDDWMSYPEYVRFYKLVNSIICVNDVAERNVQNVCKYAEYSQDPERRNRVVAVVNSHRELVDFSHLTKDELSKL